MKPPEEESAGVERLDPALVAALYAEHADDLRWFLIGVLKDADLAADALQATFAKAVESGHNARAESLKGWLFTVAYHEALALRRKQNTAEKHQRRLRQEASGATSEGTGPVRSVVRAEVVERVKAALDRLPDEQRQVVRMRIYDDKKFAQIAVELKLPLGTVLTRMQLALGKLQRSLEE